jgi:hypothetical protein
MINVTIYRLGEYRITEYENGLLRWEKLFNFGVQRSGKCFILSDILIIGHWGHEEVGYLQLEFFDQLEKLPAWNKTRYYCFAFELLNISNGQTLTNDYLESISSRSNSAGPKSETNVSTGTFRLGRYQITVNDNGELSWQTYGGLNRVVGGRCVFESGILFMDEQEYEGDQIKREFLEKLTRLPKWDNSVAWCRSLVLRTCRHQQQSEKSYFIARRQDTMDEYSFNEKPSALNLNHHTEPSKRLLGLNFKWLGRVWPCIRGGKRWLKYFIPLFVVGLMLGLVLLWYSAERKSHFSYGEKHDHKYDDD